MDILVIEDNPIDRKLLSTLFRTDGHGVIEHASAETALEEIRGRRPEVILLDLKLPGMDGLTLVRLMKANPDLRRIPILAMTAAQELFSHGAALAAGCDGYMPKPFDTRILPEMVATVVRTASQSPYGRGAG